MMRCVNNALYALGDRIEHIRLLVVSDIAEAWVFRRILDQFQRLRDLQKGAKKTKSGKWSLYTISKVHNAKYGKKCLPDPYKPFLDLDVFGHILGQKRCRKRVFRVFWGIRSPATTTIYEIYARTKHA